jgi:hypothetical protein
MQPLSQRLQSVINSFEIERLKFGAIELVEKERMHAETLFQSYAKAQPSTEDAYQAAVRLLRGETLDDWSKELVAAAISVPIREFGGATVVASDRFDALLAGYEREAQQGELWRLTWYSLFTSYLSFDLTTATKPAAIHGFNRLRSSLQQTWPYIDRECADRLVPEWVKVLREEPHLLSDKPVEKYAADYLAGRTQRIEALSSELGIPAQSWFWQELILGAVRHATDLDDSAFRAQLPLLIELIKKSPVFRDQAIVAVLVRYHRCEHPSVHAGLRDYVIQPSVWRNPKLKVAGMATAWNQVPEPVWRMVMGWVNERNLRDFFDLLAARRNADHGRLRFWSRYMNQISWTRLVFGYETVYQKNHNKGIKALLESEEGTFAMLRGSVDKELDAFLMQIGSYVFVEFSKTNNGAYGYRTNELPFDRDAPTYAGSTSDLKSGFYKSTRQDLKIIHTPGWESRAEDQLRAIGIYPDVLRPVKYKEATRLTSDHSRVLEELARVAERSQVQPTVPVTPVQRIQNTRYSQMLERVQTLLQDYPGMQATQTGDGLTRRIWVVEQRRTDGLPKGPPISQVELSKELKELGFRWALGSKAWYWYEE